MKKIQKLLLIFLATWLLVLPCLSSIESLKASWLSPNGWGDHSLIADDGGEIITDTVKPPPSLEIPATVEKSGQNIKMHFSKFLIQDHPDAKRLEETGEEFQGYWVDGNYGMDTAILVYQFTGITSDSIPFYIIFRSNDLVSYGLFYLDTSNKKFYKVVSSVDYSAEKIKESSLPPLYKGYLLQFIGGAPQIGNGSYPFNRVQNLSPGVIANTESDLKCSDLSISVDYGDTSELKESDFVDKKEYARWTNKLPPDNAVLKLYWKPFGSPIWKTTAVKQSDKIKDDNKFAFDVQNLQPGYYYLTSHWSLKRSNDNAQWRWDNEAGEHDFLAWLTRIGLGTFRNMNYRVYGGGTTFQITKTGSEPVYSCPTFSVERLSEYDHSSDDATGVCGSPNAASIFSWAFCEMVYAVKALADWSSKKAESMFATMTNLYTTGEGTIEEESPTTTNTFEKVVNLGDNHYKHFHDAVTAGKTITATFESSGKSYPATATFSNWVDPKVKIILSVKDLPQILSNSKWTGSIAFGGVVHTYEGP